MCARARVRSILTFVWQMGLCYSLCLLHSLDLLCVCMLCFDLCSALFGMSTFGLACACVFLLHLSMCVHACVCACTCALDCKYTFWLAVYCILHASVCAYQYKYKQLSSVQCACSLWPWHHTSTVPLHPDNMDNENSIQKKSDGLCTRKRYAAMNSKSMGLS